MNNRLMGGKILSVSSLIMAVAMILGCDVATDPVRYEDFVKAEGEGEFGTWVHSGLYNRTYYLHLPPDMDETRTYPLLIFLHGAGGTGEALHWILDADEVTDSAGYVTVFPDGLERTWSVGCDECTEAEALEADDITFLQTLSRHLAEHIHIDTTKVYVAGYSQGGSLAHLFGCRASNSPAGIAGVGALAFRSLATDCDPSRPFPVVMIHGTEDLLAFYGGYGFEAPLQSVPETMEMWSEVFNCDQTPVLSQIPGGEGDFTTVTQFLFGGCDPGSSLIHYRVNLGGHTWPGPTGPWSPLAGAHSRAIDATRRILSFFESGSEGT